MLRFLYADDLHRHPRLAAAMFRDRAAQFFHRHGWAVTVDDQGEERDRYDALNPLYVVWERPDGLHGGSARFLPTTGPTMVEDHFLHLTGGTAFRSPFIWECTRFCLAPGGDGARVASALMLGGGELMRAFALTHFIGVFDAPMIRAYRQMGAVPQVLGSRDGISAGLWPQAPETRATLAARAGIAIATAEDWFARSFGPAAPGTARAVA